MSRLLYRIKPRFVNMEEIGQVPEHTTNTN